MTDMNRRSTLAFGFVTASLLALPKSAVAETYGSDEGKELAPGYPFTSPLIAGVARGIGLAI